MEATLYTLLGLAGLGGLFLAYRWVFRQVWAGIRWVYRSINKRKR